MYQAVSLVPDMKTLPSYSLNLEGGGQTETNQQISTKGKSVDNVAKENKGGDETSLGM